MTPSINRKCILIKNAFNNIKNKTALEANVLLLVLSGWYRKCTLIKNGFNNTINYNNMSKLNQIFGILA